MEIEIKAFGGDAKVEFVMDESVKTEILTRLLAWYKEHDCYAGEVLCQSDSCLIDAPELLAEIADEVLKFKVTWL